MGGVFTRLCFQVYEGRVRSINLEGISSLQDVDLRLNTWRNRMELMDDVSLQVHLSCTSNRNTYLEWTRVCGCVFLNMINGAPDHWDLSPCEG